jgi:HEAT repeat protein
MRVRIVLAMWLLASGCAGTVDRARVERDVIGRVDLGFRALASGSHKIAVPVFEDALRRAKELGHDDPLVAPPLSGLVWAYTLDRRPALADETAQRVLALGDRAPSHPASSLALFFLGWSYIATGQPARAEPVMLRGFRAADQAFGAGHPIPAAFEAGLATVYLGMLQPAKAEPLVARALAAADAIESRMPAPGTPSGVAPPVSFFILALEGVANSYLQQGVRAGVEPILHRVLALQRRLGFEANARITAARIEQLRNLVHTEAINRALPEDVDGLAGVLKDRDPIRRIAAARMLKEKWAGNPTVKRAVPALQTSLMDPVPEVRAMVLDTVLSAATAAPEAVVALAEVARLETPATRIHYLWLLGNMRETALPARPIVVQILKTDADTNVRIGAVAALGRIGSDAETIDILVDVLADPALQPAAADALKRSVTTVVFMLEPNLRMPAVAGRRRAAESLRIMAPAAPSDILPILTRALQDDDGQVRRASAEGIVATGPDALPVLHAALAHADPVVRGVAATALGAFGAQRVDIEGALRSLTKALEDPDGSVRAAAARALGAMGRNAAAAVDTLRRIGASDVSIETRAEAQAALQKIAGR